MTTNASNNQDSKTAIWVAIIGALAIIISSIFANQGKKEPSPAPTTPHVISNAPINSQTVIVTPPENEKSTPQLPPDVSINAYESEVNVNINGTQNIHR